MSQKFTYEFWVPSILNRKRIKDFKVRGPGSFAGASGSYKKRNQHQRNLARKETPSEWQ